MYFSLIEPVEGAEREAVFARLKGPYAEHQWLWRFFAAPEGAPRDFLFRRMERSGRSRFYVVSAREPRAVDDAWEVRSRSFVPEIRTGQRIFFDLRANPVVTVQRDGKKRRDDVVMSEKKKLLRERGLAKWKHWTTPDRPAEYELVARTCRDWLCEPVKGVSRAEKAGFSVLKGRLQVDAYRQHRMGEKGVLFSSVDFSGELEVTDRDAFISVLQNGLGHAKAFGCGLLLVRPASS